MNVLEYYMRTYSLTEDEAKMLNYKMNILNAERITGGKGRYRCICDVCGAVITLDVKGILNFNHDVDCNRQSKNEIDLFSPFNYKYVEYSNLVAFCATYSYNYDTVCNEYLKVKDKFSSVDKLIDYLVGIMTNGTDTIVFRGKQYKYINDICKEYNISNSDIFECKRDFKISAKDALMHILKERYGDDEQLEYHGTVYKDFEDAANKLRLKNSQVLRFRDYNCSFEENIDVLLAERQNNNLIVYYIIGKNRHGKILALCKCKKCGAKMYLTATQCLTHMHGEMCSSLRI